MTDIKTSGAVNYVHVNDDDHDWLMREVAMLDETIRQTLRYQGSESRAVLTLATLRDRYTRIANRLKPSVTFTCTP